MLQIQRWRSQEINRVLPRGHGLLLGVLGSRLLPGVFSLLVISGWQQPFQCAFFVLNVVNLSRLLSIKLPPLVTSPGPAKDKFSTLELNSSFQIFLAR